MHGSEVAFDGISHERGSQLSLLCLSVSYYFSPFPLAKPVCLSMIFIKYEPKQNSSIGFWGFFNC